MEGAGRTRPSTTGIGATAGTGGSSWAAPGAAAGRRVEAGPEFGDGLDRYCFRLMTRCMPTASPWSGQPSDDCCGDWLHRYAGFRWAVRVIRAPQGPAGVMGAMAGALASLPFTTAASILMTRPDPQARDLGADLAIAGGVIWTCVCLGAFALYHQRPAARREHV